MDKAILENRKYEFSGASINVNFLLSNRFECSLPESVAILAEIGGNKFILIVAYIPPRYDKNKFIEELDKELEILAQKNIPIVLAGDFNINTLILNNLQQSYLNSITANGFEL